MNGYSNYYGALSSISLPALTTQQLSANFNLNSNLVGSLPGGGYGGYAYTTNCTNSIRSSMHVESMHINGVDVGKTLEDIKSRLAILTPDLSKIEKFAALKRAYDNYKMIESMCITNNQCSP